MLKKLALFVLIACGSACTKGDGGNPDLSGIPSNSDLSRSTDGAVPAGTLQCTNYISVASIAAMRTPGGASHVAGCVALNNVVVIGLTSSQNKPRLFVQDPAGGDYSAVMAKCSQTGLHTCMSLPTVTQATSGQLVTIQGHYVFSSTSGFDEVAIEHVILTGSGTLPAPAAVTLADLEVSAKNPKLWAQKVTTTVPAGNPLVMFDYSPTELKTSSGGCPFYSGFSMIPKASASAGFAAMGCSGTSNPAPVVNQPGEILINRFFYSDFNWHCDCACQSGVKILLNPTATVAGGTQIAGVLVYEINIGNSNSGHLEFLPMNMTEFPITN